MVRQAVGRRGRAGGGREGRGDGEVRREELSTWPVH